MSNEPPARRPGDGGDWDADAPDAWDEPEAVRASDAHSRLAREDAGTGEGYDGSDAGEYHDPYDDDYVGHDGGHYGGHVGDPHEAHGGEHAAAYASGRPDGGDEHYDHDQHADGAHYDHDEDDVPVTVGVGERKPLLRRLLVYAVALAVVAGGVGVAVGVFRPIYQLHGPQRLRGAGAG